MMPTSSPPSSSSSKIRRLPRIRSDLRHRIEEAGARLVFGFFRLLPLDAASALGGFIGRLIGRFAGITNRARTNLRRAMPALSDEAVERILQGMWDNLGRVIAEYPHLGEFRIFEPGGRVEPEGIEHVEQVLAAGKSCIFVSGHFGNWEVATLTATQYGLDVTQIYRAANNPRVDALIRRFRGVVGSELAPKGQIAARKSIESLRRGRHLAMLVDQKMNDGIPVPFFGRDAMTPAAPAQLALRFNGAIIPARVERTRGAHFRVTIFPAVTIEPSSNRDADTRAMMKSVNTMLEDWIRARPDQWFWLHRRWPD